MTRLYKIAVGRADKGVIENIEKSWAGLVKGFTRHKVSPKKGGAFFVGGSFKGTRRVEDELVSRSLLTLDIDDSGMTLGELQLGLQLGLDCAFVAYSTYSHSVDIPKIRVIVPLSSDIKACDYRDLSMKVCSGIGIKVDACSYKANQLMYMPTAADLDGVWTFVQDGEPLLVDELVGVGVVGAVGAVGVVAAVESNDEAQGLIDALKEEPLDISDAEVDAYLVTYPALGLSYDDWFKVGCSLHHQFRGSEAGFVRWYEWSLLGKFDEDEDKMRRKWPGLGKRENIRTFASVKWSVKDRFGIVLDREVAIRADLFDDLLVEASNIDDMGSYSAFKTKILKINATVLGSDLRGMLASELANSFGKSVGITKAEIKKALTPVKGGGDFSRGGGGDGVVELPEWLVGWIYVESQCLFYHVELNYGIRREAFNAKHDREDECVAGGMQASHVALVVFKIETVVDTIYWAGGAEVLRYEGKLMLNTYRRVGVAPCSNLLGDVGGLEVIDLMLKHLDLLIADRKEQLLLLHWLVFIYQNPGKKLNWSIVLQGCPGSGKTYFADLMKLLLGDGVRSLGASSIGGRFNGWATGCVLNVVEEIRVAGSNRYEILDMIKPLISNNVIQIEEKGKDHRTVPNFTSYLMLTNHKDALPLGDEDRRYCVLFSEIQTKEQLYAVTGGSEEACGEYFDMLFDRTRERADAIARFFTDYVLPESFKPFGRAPVTVAKEEMSDLAISGPRQVLEDLLDKHRCGCITKDFIDVSYLNDLCEGLGDELPRTKGLSSILLEMGFRQMKGRYFRTYKPEKKHYVWVKEGKSDEWVKEEIRKFLKDENDI
jgi:hypothetical protein